MQSYSGDITFANFKVERDAQHGHQIAPNIDSIAINFWEDFDSVRAELKCANILLRRYRCPIDVLEHFEPIRWLEARQYRCLGWKNSGVIRIKLANMEFPVLLD